MIINRLKSYSKLTSTLFHSSPTKSTQFTSSNLLTQNSFSFAKKKKPTMMIPTIHISKFNKQADGFILYQNNQGNRFRMITVAFLAAFTTGYWAYSHINDDQIQVNYMILGAMLLVPFLIFQVRTGKTLKSLVLSQNGQQMVLTHFKWGGFHEQNIKGRVELLKGIGKAFVFGGSVIRGGGSYGYEEKKFWFQAKHITERQIFQEVVQGHQVKVDKQKFYE